ncbi:MULTISPECIES: hypothetical protein [Actinoplanes]|uniref:DUF304 domain-containing protein n=2 Tax=Actinoplanes TaxID=1865 RepID=A0A0X3V4C2_9ACTN|nr:MULTISPECIES: hypothetical protein [Actinoplanes]KUL39580.1 hypothetical protein ADL15_09110 [Actinoplanes awajinensis subsp. mycoplanecinus]
MTSHVDQVLGPADDTVSFIQPRGMVYVTTLWVAAAGWTVVLAVYLLCSLLFGARPGAADIAFYAESALIVPVIVAAAVLLVLYRRLGWLHTSVHGIDFAATGRKAVHLPWSGIASVGLHGWGPFTELVITPIDADYAQVIEGPGLAVRMRHRGAETSYVIDVGLMSPGPEVLLAELHRRIPSKV